MTVPLDLHLTNFQLIYFLNNDIDTKQKLKSIYIKRVPRYHTNDNQRGNVHTKTLLINDDMKVMNTIDRLGILNILFTCTAVGDV
jgi:hypothetical protein